ncbi:MAG: multiprotein-bridging factor 1 family protein [Actinomycetales bacterium]
MARPQGREVVAVDNAISTTTPIPMPNPTHITDWNALAAVVKGARARRGWTQSELAERAMVSRSWVAKLERGHRGAELEQILRLLQALQVNLLVQPVGAQDDSPESTRQTGHADVGPIDESTRERRAARQRRRDAWAQARRVTATGLDTTRGAREGEAR